MKNFSNFVVFIGCLIIAEAAGKFQSKSLPSYITPCKRNELLTGDCGVNSGNAALPFLLKGDKEFQTPDVLPLKVPRLELKSIKGLEFTLTDITLWGLDTLRIQKFILDPVKKHADSAVKDKYLTFNCKYNINGSILDSPIFGSGPASITVYGKLYTFNFDYDLHKKDDGKEYMRIIKYETGIDAERTYFHFENLFNGDKVLGDKMNKFLNEHSDEIAKTLIYPVVAQFSELLTKQTFNAIITNVPYDEVFPL